jgi:hypothetical protein
MGVAQLDRRCAEGAKTTCSSKESCYTVEASPGCGSEQVQYEKQQDDVLSQLERSISPSYSCVWLSGGLFDFGRTMQIHAWCSGIWIQNRELRNTPH